MVVHPCSHQCPNCPCPVSTCSRFMNKYLQRTSSLLILHRHGKIVQDFYIIRCIRNKLLQPRIVVVMYVCMYVVLKQKKLLQCRFNKNTKDVTGFKFRLKKKKTVSLILVCEKSDNLLVLSLSFPYIPPNFCHLPSRLSFKTIRCLRC